MIQSTEQIFHLSHCCNHFSPLNSVLWTVCSIPNSFGLKIPLFIHCQGPWPLPFPIVCSDSHKCPGASSERQLLETTFLHVSAPAQLITARKLNCSGKREMFIPCCTGLVIALVLPKRREGKTPRFPDKHLPNSSECHCLSD